MRHSRKAQRNPRSSVPCVGGHVSAEDEVLLLGMVENNVFRPQTRGRLALESSERGNAEEKTLEKGKQRPGSLTSQVGSADTCERIDSLPARGCPLCGCFAE